jgi:hypothetical protein
VVRDSAIAFEMACSIHWEAYAEKVFLGASATCLQREQKAVIALLDQVQHVNGRRSVPFSDGHDPGQGWLRLGDGLRIRLIAMRQHVMRESGFFSDGQ